MMRQNTNTELIKRLNQVGAAAAAAAVPKREFIVLDESAVDVIISESPVLDFQTNEEHAEGAMINLLSRVYGSRNASRHMIYAARDLLELTHTSQGVPVAHRAAMLHSVAVPILAGTRYVAWPMDHDSTPRVTDPSNIHLQHVSDFDYLSKLKFIARTFFKTPFSTVVRDIELSTAAFTGSSKSRDSSDRHGSQGYMRTDGVLGSGYVNKVRSGVPPAPLDQVGIQFQDMTQMQDMTKVKVIDVSLYMSGLAPQADGTVLVYTDDQVEPTRLPATLIDQDNILRIQQNDGSTFVLIDTKRLDHHPPGMYINTRPPDQPMRALNVPDMPNKWHQVTTWLTPRISTLLTKKNTLTKMTLDISAVFNVVGWPLDLPVHAEVLADATRCLRVYARTKEHRVQRLVHLQDAPDAVTDPHLAPLIEQGLYSPYVMHDETRTHLHTSWQSVHQMDKGFLLLAAHAKCIPGWKPNSHEEHGIVKSEKSEIAAPESSSAEASPPPPRKNTPNKRVQSPAAKKKPAKLKSMSGGDGASELERRETCSLSADSHRISPWSMLTYLAGSLSPRPTITYIDPCIETAKRLELTSIAGLTGVSFTMTFDRALAQLVGGRVPEFSRVRVPPLSHFEALRALRDSDVDVTEGQRRTVAESRAYQQTLISFFNGLSRPRVLAHVEFMRITDSHHSIPSFTRSSLSGDEFKIGILEMQQLKAYVSDADAKRQLAGENMQQNVDISATEKREEYITLLHHLLELLDVRVSESLKVFFLNNVIFMNPWEIYSTRMRRSIQALKSKRQENLLKWNGNARTYDAHEQRMIAKLRTETLQVFMVRTMAVYAALLILATEQGALNLRVVDLWGDTRYLNSQQKKQIQTIGELGAGIVQVCQNVLINAFNVTPTVTAGVSSMVSILIAEFRAKDKRIPVTFEISQIINGTSHTSPSANLNVKLRGFKPSVTRGEPVLAEIEVVAKEHALNRHGRLQGKSDNMMIHARKKHNKVMFPWYVSKCCQAEGMNAVDYFMKDARVLQVVHKQKEQARRGLVQWKELVKPFPVRTPLGSMPAAESQMVPTASVRADVGFNNHFMKSSITEQLDAFISANPDNPDYRELVEMTLSDTQRQILTQTYRENLDQLDMSCLLNMNNNNNKDQKQRLRKVGQRPLNYQKPQQKIKINTKDLLLGTRLFPGDMQLHTPQPLVIRQLHAVLWRFMRCRVHVILSQSPCVGLEHLFMPVSTHSDTSVVNSVRLYIVMVGVFHHVVQAQSIETTTLFSLVDELKRSLDFNVINSDEVASMLQMQYDEENLRRISNMDALTEEERQILAEFKKLRSNITWDEVAEILGINNHRLGSNRNVDDDAIDDAIISGEPVAAEDVDEENQDIIFGLGLAEQDDNMSNDDVGYT